MLKLKFRYFGHLMWRASTLEKTLILGKIDGRRRRRWQRMAWLDDISDSRDMSLNKFQETMKDREAWHAAIHGVTRSRTRLSNWTRTQTLGLMVTFEQHQENVSWPQKQWQTLDSAFGLISEWCLIGSQNSTPDPILWFPSPLSPTVISKIVPKPSYEQFWFGELWAQSWALIGIECSDNFGEWPSYDGKHSQSLSHFSSPSLLFVKRALPVRPWGLARSPSLTVQGDYLTEV